MDELVLDIPDFLADIELLEWSKPDHSIQEATSDVIAATYKGSARTRKILQSHFNGDTSSSDYVAKADEVLKGLTTKFEACDAAAQRKLMGYIVNDLRYIRWLPCKTYEQLRLSFFTIALCATAFCAAFDSRLPKMWEAWAAFPVTFLILESKDIQNLLRVLYRYRF